MLISGPMTQHDRYQYILSIAALGFSAIAMIIAFLELRSSDRQLEANVWPYVDMNINLERDSFQLALENKGMGPALIHEFRVLLDGTEVRHSVELIEAADRPLQDLTMSTASVPDSVLSVGDELIAYQVEGTDIGIDIRNLVPRMEIQICYCSLNNQCWDNRGDERFRRRVERCDFQSVDVEGALQYFEDAGADGEDAEAGE